MPKEWGLLGMFSVVAMYSTSYQTFEVVARNRQTEWVEEHTSIHHTHPLIKTLNYNVK